MRLQYRYHKGFTLTELLVVIAILAILVMVVVPAVTSALSRARRASCAQNLKEIGTALRLYANDHDGRMPGTTHGQAHTNSWVYTLAPYLGDLDAIRICPSDPQAKARRAAKGTSYVMNEYVTVPQFGMFGVKVQDSTNLDRLSYPAETFTCFIGADELPVHITADHTHSRNWSGGWESVCQDISPDRHRTGKRAKDRTEGSANYLMADGRVQTLDAARVKAMAEENPDWARPPD